MFGKSKKIAKIALALEQTLRASKILENRVICLEQSLDVYAQALNQIGALAGMEWDMAEGKWRGKSEAIFTHRPSFDRADS